MHSLYIQVENDAAVNHPAYKDNLLKAFGAIPANWEPFVRVEKPVPTIYQFLDNQEPVYTKVAGLWTDVWPLLDLTGEEKTAKQQVVKDAWAMREQAANFVAWVFDEVTCRVLPPISRPATGNYRWSGADNNWREAPAMPETGGPYKFDFTQWIWVAV